MMEICWKMTEIVSNVIDLMFEVVVTVHDQTRFEREFMTTKITFYFYGITQTGVHTKAHTCR